MPVIRVPSRQAGGYVCAGQSYIMRPISKNKATLLSSPKNKEYEFLFNATPLM